MNASDRIFRSLATCALLLAGLAPAPASAQSAPGVAPSVSAQDRGRPSRIVPATRATRENIERRGPVVDYELGAEGGWYYMPPFLQWRFLEPGQWVTSDPIVEVHVYPPYSGSQTNIEAFLLQIPTSMPAPVQDRALIVGFHGSSISPLQIFGGTSGPYDLPQLCTARGWFLLGPNGHHTSNMGSEPNQRAYEVDLALLASLFQFNWEKVYTLGFSMGGLSATSFAFRHQDPYTPRVAGIIYHSGTTDIIRDYDEAPAATKHIWEDPLVFGATPTQDPFGYDRVNPARFNATRTGFLDDYFQLDSLKHTPFYVHANFNDQTKYSGWTMQMASKMLARGFTMQTAYISTPTPTHWMGTLDYDAAVDYVTQWTADTLPTGSKIFADRPGRWLWSKLVNDPAPNVARYEVHITALTNGFSVTDTHHVDTLGLDLPLMGLDASQPVSFTTMSGDGTPDTYVLSAYASAPSIVLADGGPPAAWSYDPISGSVSITPNTNGVGALVQVIP